MTFVMEFPESALKRLDHMEFLVWEVPLNVRLSNEFKWKKLNLCKYKVLYEYFSTSFCAFIRQFISVLVNFFRKTQNFHQWDDSFLFLLKNTVKLNLSYIFFLVFSWIDIFWIDLHDIWKVLDQIYHDISNISINIKYIRYIKNLSND
jgi:hypothetical protein